MPLARRRRMTGKNLGTAAFVAVAFLVDCGVSGDPGIAGVPGAPMFAGPPASGPTETLLDGSADGAASGSPDAGNWPGSDWNAGGCHADVSSDSANCGACGHGCLGGAC